MDTAYVNDINSRMDSEQGRTCPPPDFPTLPDIPLGRYVDPDFHRAEIEGIFGRTWLFGGHASELLEAGCYRLLDLPAGQVVLIRGEDGALRAFRNACRHRGAPVVENARGMAKRVLTCPYHAWSYDLAGCLVGVPEARDFIGLDRGGRGLVPVRCESWGEFAFVNLDPGAPPLLRSIAPLAERYSDLMTAEFRHVTTKSWTIRCNWKAVIEGFIEIYHLAAVHPTTIRPFINIRRAVIQLHPGGHSSIFVPFRVGGPDAAPEEMARFLPRDVPQVPDLPDLYRDASPSLFGFPNLVAPTDSTGFPMITFWPTAMDQTRVELNWYAPGAMLADASSPVWDSKLSSWDVLMAEDNRILDGVQRSIETAGHPGAPLSYQERRLWHFNATIDDHIGPDRVPEGLRVPDLLKHHVEP